MSDEYAGPLPPLPSGGKKIETDPSTGLAVYGKKKKTIESTDSYSGFSTGKPTGFKYNRSSGRGPSSFDRNESE